jgi:S1-C subfamily serine protease
MHMGTSSDLMLAETVYAVGNAFGYEHTVTQVSSVNSIVMWRLMKLSHTKI